MPASMKVTRDMLHDELRPYYWPLMLFARAANTAAGSWLLDRIPNVRTYEAPADLDSEQRLVPSTTGGHEIRVMIYRPSERDGDLPGFLYLHGGAYRSGRPEMYSALIKAFIDTRPCAVFAPAYRLSPEAPFPAGFDDCYDTLLWMRDHAETLGIRSDQLIVGGHSAGGGMTAAITLRARDTADVDVALQLPLYPMLDDRQETTSSRFNAPLYGAEQNADAWDLYLRGLHAAAQPVPAYAAAARATDHAGLPPTVTFVGGIDPFRDETIAYVDALRAEGIPVAFTVFDGCFHGFDFFQNTDIARQATRFAFDSYAAFYDQYVDA